MRRKKEDDKPADDRPVMTYVYADLHLRGGDVIPYFLYGEEMKPGQDLDVDYYTETYLRPIFTGQHERQDGAGTHYWGPTLECLVGGTMFVIRRDEVSYVTLRAMVHAPKELDPATGRPPQTWPAGII